jgi:hypothetical protein
MALWTIAGLEKYTSNPAPVFKTKKQAEYKVLELAMMRARGLEIVKIEKEQN